MSIALNLSSKQLRLAADLRERIDKLEKQLATILGSAPQVPVPAAANRAGPRRRKGGMSKQARARQSEVMRKRWAKVKAAGKKRL